MKENTQQNKAIFYETD